MNVLRGMIMLALVLGVGRVMGVDFSSI